MTFHITAIAAIAENGVMGKEGGLPWHLPEDLKFFKAQTLGKPLILGRKTWESFGGRPLPHRPHFILTTQKDYTATGATVCSSFQKALEGAKASALSLGVHEVMVIGGAEIYTLSYPFLTKILLTRVYGSPEGDTVFPSFPLSDWSKHTLGECETHCYEQYERITSSTTLP
jgi:dihydrofolate reductase